MIRAAYLGATNDGDKGTLRVGDRAIQVVQLLLQQQARCRNKQAHASVAAWATTAAPFDT